MSYLSITIKSVLVMLFLCFLSQLGTSQNNENLILFTEATSHLRGNRSQNISIEYSKNRFVNSFGLDIIYVLTANERELQKGKISYGINYKIGVDLLEDPNKSLSLGFNLRYTRFHMHHLDTNFDDEFSKRNVYDKSYHKITPLGIIQYSVLRDNGFYYGFQIGLGQPFFKNIESEINRSHPGIDREDDWFFSHIFEHGYHKNYSGPTPDFAFQFNLLFGIKIR